jgi:hypothetical protein
MELTSELIIFMQTIGLTEKPKHAIVHITEKKESNLVWKPNENNQEPPF